MLSPDQLQSIAAQRGDTVVPQETANSVDKLKSAWTTSSDTSNNSGEDLTKRNVPFAESPVGGYLMRIHNSIQSGMKDVQQNMQEGVDKFKEGTQEANNGGGIASILKGASGLVEPVIRTASDALDIAASPLTAALQPVIEKAAPDFLKSTNILNAISPEKFGKTNADTIEMIASIAKEHPDATKDVSSLINILTAGLGTGAAEEVETAIKSTIKDSVTAGKDAASGAVASTKTLANSVKDTASDIAVNSEKGAWEKPTTVPKAAYNKATDIYDNAANQGHDVSDTLAKNNIKLSDNVDTVNGKRVYNTADTAEKIHADAAQTSNDLLRPALEKADASGAVERTPVKDLIDAAKENLSKNKSLEAETRDGLISDLDKAQQSLEKEHPDGMSLTDLHDEKIVRDLNSRYNQLSDTAKTNKAINNKSIADAARTMVEDKAPADIPVKEFNAELTKLHQSANYLDALHGKPVPQSIWSRIANTTAKVVGASAGHAMGGGILGSVGGYHIGGMIENLVENMPNPVKNVLLNNLKHSNPEAFDAVKAYLEKTLSPKEMEGLDLNLPDIPEKTHQYEMGSYKLQKNPTSGLYELSGQYRKPGVNFYPPKKK